MSPLLTREQQNEARLDRKFEEIINAAKASKSIGRMFSDGTVETLATPDSTFSTLDKNSNFGTHKKFLFVAIFSLTRVVFYFCGVIGRGGKCS